VSFLRHTGFSVLVEQRRSTANRIIMISEPFAEIDASFADSISFAFLPGDIADDGSHSAYAVVRRTLDGLQVPWCAIVGDHDVHEKSFTNFIGMMSEDTQYAFTACFVRFSLGHRNCYRMTDLEITVALACLRTMLEVIEKLRQSEPESFRPCLAVRIRVRASTQVPTELAGPRAPLGPAPPANVRRATREKSDRGS